MSIPSLSSSSLASLLANAQNTGSTAGTDTASSVSGQGNTQSGDSTAQILQEIVSLGTNPAKASDTYTMKGLLQQFQANMAMNDPLLTGADSSADSSSDPLSSLFGGLEGASSGSTTLDAVVKALLSGSNGASSGNDGSTSAAQTDGASSANSLNQLVDAIKKNPSLASTLIAGATNQGLLSKL